MARPSEDIVVEVEDLNSSGGTGTSPKCIGSAMRKTVLPKVEKFGRLSLDLQLFFVRGKPTTDPDWEEWRNSLWLTLGGHTIGGLVGFGGDGQSAHKHFLRFTGQEQKPEANWFGKQAMQHGREKEAYAKWYYLNINSGEKNEECYLYGSESLLYEIVLNGGRPSIGVCVTPDMLYENRVVEIKCPYYNNDKFDDPVHYRTDVRTRNMKKYSVPYNISWWIQAAFYSMITGKSEFVLLVCYYTTRTDKCVFDRFYFRMGDSVRVFLVCELEHVIRSLETPPKGKYTPSLPKVAIPAIVFASQANSATSYTYSASIDGTLHLVKESWSLSPCLDTIDCMFEDVDMTDDSE